MINWHDASTDELCDALMLLKSREEVYAFLEDICTIKEVQDMGQRLQVAKMLDEKIPYTEICSKTGISSATVSRVSKAYTYGGGYRLVIERLAQNAGKEKDNKKENG